MFINHIDGVKSNNALSNFELVTTSGNAIHALTLGLMTPRKGQQQGQSKFTDKQVITLRKKFVEGKRTVLGISRKYEVSKATVCLMLKGSTYKHLDTGYEDRCASILRTNSKTSSKHISSSLIMQIKKLHAQGLSSYAISEKTGLARNTVMKYW
jgi:uncharacterized protein YoaH (UPF0181 family)